jgi:hypothetical protein
MEIVFAGICCWVDARAPKTGKTVIIRNAESGGTHGGAVIPAHSAFIHAKRSEVNTESWSSDWAGSEDLIFRLGGDYLTIDPTPRGGSIDISLLPHVRERVTTNPICPAADEIRPGFLDDPTPERVLALLDLPADADVYSGTNANGAFYAALRMPAMPVTITATPFCGSAAGVRSLRIEDPDARVFIANVTMADYLMGVGAPDNDHQFLVCDIFRPVSPPNAAAQRPNDPAGKAPALAGLKPPRGMAQVDLHREPIPALHSVEQRTMRTYLDTLAVGCSDTQWP